jgi:hypothetical protein
MLEPTKFCVTGHYRSAMIASESVSYARIGRVQGHHDRLRVDWRSWWHFIDDTLSDRLNCHILEAVKLWVAAAWQDFAILHHVGDGCFPEDGDVWIMPTV